MYGSCDLVLVCVVGRGLESWFINKNFYWIMICIYKDLIFSIFELLYWEKIFKVCVGRYWGELNFCD